MSGAASGTADVERTPHALESEQVLLGAMLLRGEIVAQLRALGLRPGHLWRADHEQILRTAFELDDRQLTPELFLIKDRLGNSLDGGVAYLSRLTDFGIRLPPNNVVEHVKKIHATWAARRQQVVVERYVRDLSDDPTVSLNGGVARLTESLEDIRRSVSDDDLGLLVDDATLLGGRDYEMLIDGRLSADGFAVLVGPPGAGKTFVALDLGLAVATGRRCLGADVRRAGSVVYIAADGANLKQRVHAWKTARGDPDDERLGLFIWPDAVNFLNAQEVDRFARAITSLAPILVIGDTLARCMPGGDENSARDMGLLVAHTDQIRRRVGCAFLWVHHTNRAGSERGSSALRGACDTLLKLSATQVLTCDKQRDAAPFGRLPLRLEPSDGSRIVVVAPESAANPTLTSGAQAKSTWWSSTTCSRTPVCLHGRLPAGSAGTAPM